MPCLGDILEINSTKPRNRLRFRIEIFGKTMKNFFKLFSVCLTLLLSALTVRAATVATASSSTNAPPKLSLPSFVSLKVEPARLTFLDGRDEHKVLVWGVTAAGDQYDLTAEASFQANSALVELDSQGFIHPKGAGSNEVVVSFGDLEAKLPVEINNAEIPPVNFVRDVEPVISKVGCNAGTCHGSLKGKNGFKLSLRGYDPEFDFQALVNDLSGRRVNRVAVEDSLMLLKPTAEIPHEGRQAVKPGSREYHLLHDWIAEGTKFEPTAKNRATSVEILPSRIDLDLPGRSQHLIVLAHYPNGTVRDVTRDAVLTSNNNDVAGVKDGQVTAIRRGEAAVLVKYEGSYDTRMVTVMGDRTGFTWQDQPEYNFVDKYVDAKWKRMKILPSVLTTDAEFIRRIYFDLTGMPPTSEKVRQFLEDPAPSREKRDKLAGELIGSPDFIEAWANKWADLLQCNSETLGEKGVWVYRNWIKQCLAKNIPYNKWVKEMITADGSCYQNPEVNYLRALREPGRMTEDVSQTFLGVRFNCNKCHDHPFERWTQNQYYEFGAYFAQVAIKRGSLGRETIRNLTGDRVTVAGEEILYQKYEGGEMQHPRTGMNVAPKTPYGEAKPPKDGEDRRGVFADWLTSDDNPYFALAIVNRTWSYFFGRGIIDPVDDIRGSNPASNPELLEALRADFVKNGYDLRKLMKTIVTSRVYQISIVKNKWNDDDSINFAHATPRRLSAEQLMDAVKFVTGAKIQFGGIPKGMRSVDVPDGMVEGNDFLALFGRPKRESACECERSSNVTFSHALNLINGSVIGEVVGDKSSRLNQFVEKEPDNQKVIEEIFYSVLNRPPTQRELLEVNLGKGDKRVEVAQDLTWALLNSPSFIFNR